MDCDNVVIVSGRRAAGSLQAVAAEIHAALRAHGVATEVVDVDALPTFCETEIARIESTLFLTFSHKIVFPWRQPTLSIMGDHPCQRVRQLSIRTSEHAVTAWSDASHLSALKALGFPHRAVFLPHAGPEPTEKMIPHEQREIDLLFVGTLREPTDRTVWRVTNPDASSIVADLIFDTVETVAETGAPVLPATLEVMRRHGVCPSLLTRDDFAQLMASIQDIAEVNRRVRILTALPDDLEIAIVSNHLPLALCDRPNVRYLGYIDDFERVRGLMRNARIVLNTTSKFPAGSHDRIWFAMAEGAVVVSDTSLFMQQDFQDGEAILYLPRRRLDQEDLESVIAAAKNAQQLARLSDRASSLYRERHTWTQRAPVLIEAMRAA